MPSAGAPPLDADRLAAWLAPRLPVPTADAMPVSDSPGRSSTDEHIAIATSPGSHRAASGSPDNPSPGSRNPASRNPASWTPDSRSSGSSDVTGVSVVSLTTPAVGQSNDTVLFVASWEEGGVSRSADLVVRRQPMGHQIFLKPDVIREGRVLLELQRFSRVPVPRVLWFEPDPDVLGAPFFVMAQVPGRVPSGKPSVHSVGWLPTLDPSERRHLWTSAMDTLVAVHDVDWPATHSFLLDGDPGATTLAAHLERLAGWYRWATGGRLYPITDAALAFLLDGRVQARPGAPVLVWGDARIGNMIFGSDLSVAAAIDWEVACIGPPEIDVAHWLFFDEFVTTGAGVPRLDGFPDRSETIAYYEQHSGRTLGDLAYFEVLQGFFLAVTLIRQADMAVEQGRLKAGTRMGHDNAVTQSLARRLGLPVPDLAADYLTHRQSPPPASPAP